MKKKGKKMAEHNTPTPYDEAVCSRQLQMLKTFVPYAGAHMQKQLVAAIQLMEYQAALVALKREDNCLAACAVPEGGSRATTLLSELKQYCSPGEQETIDNMLNLLGIMENRELF
jgi:hypothetical protein